MVGGGFLMIENCHLSFWHYSFRVHLIARRGQQGHLPEIPCYTDFVCSTHLGGTVTDHRETKDWFGAERWRRARVGLLISGYSRS